jgi:membrane protein DedA with SNARE-associated domain
MNISIAKILSLLLGYRYVLLFPIVVFEGPIITVIAGFFISLGYFNGPITYAIIVAADLTGDALHYSVGRLSRYKYAAKIIGFLGINQARLERVERHFEQHPKKTLLLGKMTHGIGGIPLVAAGMARMPFRKFIWINLLATLPKSLVLLLIGYFFGQYVYQIKKYFDIGAILMLILAISLAIFYFVAVRLANKSSHDE